MVTTMIGRQAEARVAEKLIKSGYKIVGHNWRRRACEIDLIALKDSVAYLVEVKYRKSDGHGDGFSYITTAKLQQMHFAAKVWVQFEGWAGDFRLMAAAVDGQDGQIEIVEID